jgi:hypothetical protein
MRSTFALALAGLLVLLMGTPGAHGWDYAVHRAVNEAALDLLPTNFPAWARTPEARERIAFLGGEMDRWRNTAHYPPGTSTT